MNLTLGSLTALKATLLPPQERAGNEHDAAIALIGKGVCRALESYCHRFFARKVGDTYECSADRAHVALPRAPIEAVTKIEIRHSIAEGWVDLDVAILNQNLATGFLLFADDLGGSTDRVRFTYTGGYYLDLGNEPDWQQGAIGVPGGASDLAVYFRAPFEKAPAVVPQLVPPPGAPFVHCAPVAITERGFVCRFSDAIPAAGYLVQWTAAVQNDQGDAPKFTQDVVDLAEGDETVAIQFPVPFAVVPAVVPFVIPGRNGTVISATPIEATLFGFTCRLGAPVPAAGYALQWTAYVEGTSPQVARDTVDLATDDEDIEIVFDDAFAGRPAVMPFIVPPGVGPLIFALPHEITDEGFSVKFAAPIPDDGYKLTWLAIELVAPASVQPNGSTVVPADLQLAWLNQCRHLWRQWDKLGSALASNNGEAVAMQLSLDEGVMENVRDYRRLSLS